MSAAGKIFQKFPVPVWSFCEVAFKYSCGVVRVFILWILFIGLTEGTLDSMGYMIIAGVVLLIACELFLKSMKPNMCRDSC